MPNNDERPRKTWVMFKKAVKGIALNSLPIGTLVKDPNSTFLGAPVIWKVADINHQGYPDNSITLITERIVAIRPFDAMEPNSAIQQNKYCGNNVYSVSNIRQWLNSDAEAGQWYTAQHSVDQAPTGTYVDNINEYADDSGFLNGFSSEFKKSLLETTLIAVNKNVTETVIDKIFLPSDEEVGTTSKYISSLNEGLKLAIFSDNNSRKTYCTAEAIADSEYNIVGYDTKPYYWRLRTPSIYDGQVGEITTDGTAGCRMAMGNSIGVRPLCNLPSTVRVSETPDERGVYTIVQFG